MAIIGKASDIAAGTIRLFELNGEAIAVANVAGAFYAFSDTCTHLGCSLADGDLAGNVVTCVCHGGEFDITSGEVVGGPPRESVKTYACQIENDDIMVT